MKGKESKVIKGEQPTTIRLRSADHSCSHMRSRDQIGRTLESTPAGLPSKLSPRLDSSRRANFAPTKPLGSSLGTLLENRGTSPLKKEQQDTSLSLGSVEQPSEQGSGPNYPVIAHTIPTKREGNYGERKSNVGEKGPAIGPQAHVEVMSQTKIGHTFHLASARKRCTHSCCDLDAGDIEEP